MASLFAHFLLSFWLPFWKSFWDFLASKALLSAFLFAVLFPCRLLLAQRGPEEARGQLKLVQGTLVRLPKCTNTIVFIMVLALFCFSCYLPFSSHLAGNLASGCSLLGLLDPFSAPSWAIFGTTWLTNVALLQGHFSIHFWVPFLIQKYTNKWTRSGSTAVGAAPFFPHRFQDGPALLGPGACFWGILGPSWGVWGALLGHPGAVFGPSWGYLGRS